jgi:hypothetical protein
VALEPRIQVTAAVAELAQPLVCLRSVAPELPSAIGALCRIGSCLPPSSQHHRPSPAPKQQFGLALQVGSEPGVSFPVLGHRDGKPCAVLVERARSPAPLGGDHLELLVVEVAQLALRPVARGQ